MVVRVAPPVSTELATTPACALQTTRVQKQHLNIYYILQTVHLEKCCIADPSQ